MRRTANYNIPVHEYGETYSASADREAFATIDNQLAGLSFTVEDGVIAGWDLTSSALNIDVSQGSGLINLNYIKTLSEKSGTLTNDKVNRVYMQRGTGINIDESAKSSMVNGTTIIPTPPATPTGLTATSTKFTVSLSWNPNIEPTLKGYNIYRSLALIGPYVLIKSVTITSYVDIELSQQTTYYYRVTAVDTSDQESPFASITVTTASDLDQPFNPTDTNAFFGNGSASLTWRKSVTPGVTGYEVIINELDSAGVVISTSTVPAGNAYSIHITSLKPNKRYSFIIKAISSNAIRSSGITISGNTLGENIPLEITSLTGTDTADSITLSWSNPSDIKKLLLSLDQDDAQGEQIDIGTVSTYTAKSIRKRTRKFETDQVTSLEIIEQLKANTDYIVRIVLVDKNGNNSQGAYFRTRTLATQPPGNPRTLIPFTGDKEVRLTWLPSPSLDVVTYLYSKDVGAGFEPDIDIGNVTSYLVTGLTNGIDVKFRIKAVDLYGNISSGAITTATPFQDMIPPDIPTNFIATSGDREANLLWSLPPQTDLDGFKIYRKLITEQSFTLLATLNVRNNFMDLALDPTKTYAYAITSFDVNGNESGQAISNAITPSNSSSLPIVENVVSIVSGVTVKLSWDSSIGSFKGYNIYRSTDPYSNFVLIKTLGALTTNYNDISLIGGETYYYYITTYVDNAELLIETGLTAPENSLLLYTITTSGGNIKTTIDNRNIIINLDYRIVQETNTRLLRHSHFLDPDNASTFSTIDVLTLSTTDNITYTTASADIVGVKPDLSFFKIKVNGVAYSAKFQYSTDKYSITFESALATGTVVTADGERSVFYIQGVIDDMHLGYRIFLNGVQSDIDAFIDKNRQIIILKKAVVTNDILEILYDPQIPSYTTSPDDLFATKINLADLSVIGNFTTSDYKTWITTNSFQDNEIVAVKINGKAPPSNVTYSISAENKSVIFSVALYGESGSPFASIPVIFLVAVGRNEVTNFLSAKKYGDLYASQFEKGTVNPKLIPEINHTGRINENALPEKITAVTNDNFSYAVDKAIGQTITFYSVFDVGDGTVLGGTNFGVKISYNFGVSWENWIFPSPVPVKKIIKDTDGWYYFITHRRVYRTMDFIQWIQMVGLESIRVIHDILEDDNKNLFLATDTGVYKFPAELRNGNEWFQTGVFEGAITEVFSLAKVPNDYYETPEYEDNYRYNYATGKYDGYGPNPNVSTLIAGTEIGVFQTIDAGELWTRFESFNFPAHHLLAIAKDSIFVHSDSSVYHTTNLFITFDKIFSNTSIDEDSILAIGDNNSIVLGTGNGLYVLKDINSSFELLDEIWNKRSPFNAVFMIGKIYNRTIISIEGELKQTDGAWTISTLIEFLKYNTPTIIVSQINKLNGYTYDATNAVFFFDKKRLASDTVEIIVDYATYFSENGKWSDIDPFADIEIYVNKKLLDSSKYTIDSTNGKIIFNPGLAKGDIVKISIYRVTLKNAGIFTHEEIDDKLELENSGLHKSFSNACLADLVQIGLANEHNFVPANDKIINGGFFIFGRPNALYDKFHSTIDYNKESGHNGNYYFAGYPRKVIKLFGNSWVISDRGIYIYNNDFSKLIEIKNIDGNADIRDIVQTNNVIFVVTSDSLYSSADGINWTKNPGKNLPSQLYCFTVFNTRFLLGTSDGVYWSSNTGDSDFGIWNRAIYMDDQDNELNISGPIYSIVVPNFAYAFVSDTPFKSTDGSTWRSMSKIAINNFIVNRMVNVNQNVFAATNYGLYYLNGNEFSQAILHQLSGNEIEITDITTSEGIAWACDSNGDVHHFSDINDIKSEITDNIDFLNTIYANTVYALNGYGIYRNNGGFYGRVQDISSGLKQFNPGEVYQIAQAEQPSQLKKLSLYIDPVILAGATYSPYYYGYEYEHSFNFTISIYESDISGTIGALLFSSVHSSNEVPTRGWYDFPVDCSIPSYFAIGFRIESSNVSSENYILWGFDFNPETTLPVKIKKTDSSIETRTDIGMLYSIYSDASAVDPENQRVLTLPAKQDVMEHSTASDFADAEFYHTDIVGGKPQMDYPESIVSIVTDMSGSMTWNDPNNDRHEFIEKIIDKYTAEYPNDVKFDLITFGGRRINSIDMDAFGTNLSGYDINTIRITRQKGTESEINIFEGRIGTTFRDTTADVGTEYVYRVYIIDTLGHVNLGRMVRIKIKAGKPPTNLGKFKAKEDNVANPDLGIRTVTLSWINPNNADYSRIIIRRSEFDYPETIDDGDLVFDGAPVGVKQSLVDTHPGPHSFVTHKRYYYTAFTINPDGIISYAENSRQDSVFITPVNRSFEKQTGGTPPFGFDNTPPGPITTLSGSTEPYAIRLKYAIPSGAAGVSIYRFDGTTIPVLTDSGFSGTLVFDGFDEEFIDRYLTNNNFYSYSVFTYDTNRNYSANISIVLKPLLTNDRIFPQPEVKKIGAEISKGTDVLLSWESPPRPEQVGKLYFDDITSFLASVSFADDIKPLNPEILTFDRTAKISGFSDPFHLNGRVTSGSGPNVPVTMGLSPNATEENLIKFEVTPETSENVASADMAINQNTNILQTVSSISITANAAIKTTDQNGKDIYRVESDSVSAVFENPLNVAIDNYPSQTVSKRKTVLEKISEADPITGKISSADFKVSMGVYAKLNESFKVRVKVQYKGQSAPDSVPVYLEVFDAKEITVKPENTDAYTTIVPGEVSSSIRPKNAELFAISTETDEVDTDGNPTGNLLVETIAEGEIGPSDNIGMVFARIIVDYRGYRSVQYLGPITFASPLDIYFPKNVIVADNADIKEQRATAMFGKVNSSDIEPVPNGTVIKWELIPFDVSGKSTVWGPATPVPPPSFFTQDNTGRSGETYSVDGLKAFVIYSATRSGIADRVFIGPMPAFKPHRATTTYYGSRRFGVNSMGQVVLKGEGTVLYKEVYKLRATVQYSGLTAVYEDLYEINTAKTSETAIDSKLFAVLEGKDGSRDAFQTIWADGRDKARFIVVADPQNDSYSGLFGGANFINCLTTQFNYPVVVLPNGHIVDIEAEGSKISTDFGENDNVGQATILDGIAVAEISTNVFIGPPPTESNSSSLEPIVTKCHGKYDSSQNSYPPGFAVIARTSIYSDEKEIVLTGGGNISPDSAPPALIKLMEPLRIDGLYARRGTENVFNHPPDGVTETAINCEVSFAGDLVPVGTIIKFKAAISRNNAVALLVEDGTTSEQKLLIDNPDIVLTTTEAKVYHEVIDGEMKSLATTVIQPINDIFINKITVNAEINFDMLGTVERSMTKTIDLSVAGIDTGMDNDWVATKLLQAYLPDQNKWERKADMSVAREGATSQYVNDLLYVIGGFRGIYENTVEEYHPIEDAWVKKKSMITRRCNMMSVVYNNQIYVIGGEGLTSGRVSKKLESYNTATDTWAPLADMPGPVSLGIAQVVGNYIYVFGGASLVSDKNTVTDINRSVYRYNIAANSWEIIPTLQYIDAKYIRIGAGSRIDGTDIIVFGGSPPFAVEYLETTFGFDTINKQFYDISDITKQLPFGKSLSAIAVSSGNIYDIGGSATKSRQLNSTFIYNGSIWGTNIAKMLFAVTNATAASKGIILTDPIYVAGGGGSGHDPGWVKISVIASPNRIATNGRENSLIEVNAVDDSGDPPDRPVRVQIKGYLYEQKAATKKEKTLTAGDLRSFVAESELEATQATAPTQEEITKALTGYVPFQERTSVLESAPLISILPVVFSEKDIVLNDGTGVSQLLPRSDDLLPQTKDLAEYATAKEIIVQPPEGARGLGGFTITADGTVVVKAGETRSAYTIAIEATIDDDYYYGKTDTLTLLSAPTALDTTATTGLFSTIPPLEDQELSAQVEFVSNETWIPAVTTIFDAPTADIVALKNEIEKLKNIIPFGGSPLYDAMINAAIRLRNPSYVSNSLSMIATNDNDPNADAGTVQSTIDALLETRPKGGLPAFINTFIVTDPISLAARKARTDVVSMELISEETDGESYSISHGSFLDTIVKRIVKDAVASSGTGTIINRFVLPEESYVQYIQLIANQPGISQAQIRYRFSQDGFVFGEFSEYQPANQVIVINDIFSKVIEYEVKFTSPNFEVPILTSVSLAHTVPTIQTIFTNPISTASSLIEIAIAANGAFPAGAKLEIGAANTEGTDFSIYASDLMPAIGEGGKLTLINRKYQPSANFPANEILQTTDGRSYNSPLGPWADDNDVEIRRNGSVVLSYEYRSEPSTGLVLFKRRQSLSDVITLGLTPPNKFRVGVRITNNSSLETAILDEFGFIYNTADGRTLGQVNRLPIASNLFVGITRIGPPKTIPEGEPANWWTALQYEIRIGTKKFTLDELRALTTDERNYLFNLSNVDPHPELTAEDLAFATADINPQGFMVIGIYDYYDPDGDVESDAAIEWTIDKLRVYELDNKFQFTTSDIRSTSMKKGSTIFMTVRVNDGKQYGNPENSPQVIVGNSPPSAFNVKLFGVGDPKSSREYTINSPNSKNGVKITYEFFDADNDVEQGTIIKFFKNGTLVKQTTSNDPYVLPGETFNDAVILVSNATITAQVIPCDGLTFGTAISTTGLVILGSPPVVSDVAISPKKPNLGQDLQLTYKYSDPDQQSDQSTIQWYKNGVQQTALDGYKIITAAALSVGEVWYVNVTPFDGESTGAKQRSNTVVIS